MNSGRKKFHVSAFTTNILGSELDWQARWLRDLRATAGGCWIQENRLRSCLDSDRRNHQ